MPKLKSHNGFEFYSENIFGNWHWSFRPVGTAWFTSAPGPKDKFMALLAKPEEALDYYLVRRRMAQDVETAKAQLVDAEAFHARVSSPNYDPGGNTNNPGKVARASQEASQSKAKIDAAHQRIKDATHLRQLFEAEPFDEQAWRSRWLVNHSA